MSNLDSKDYKRLIKLSTSLVKKLELVTSGDGYKGIFLNAFIHGLSYSGPNFGKELTALKQLLEEIKHADN